LFHGRRWRAHGDLDALGHLAAHVLEELALPVLRPGAALQLALTPRVAEQDVPQRVVVELRDLEDQFALDVLLDAGLR